MHYIKLGLASNQSILVPEWHFKAHCHNHCLPWWEPCGNALYFLYCIFTKHDTMLTGCPRDSIVVMAVAASSAFILIEHEVCNVTNIYRGCRQVSFKAVTHVSVKLADYVVINGYLWDGPLARKYLGQKKACLFAWIQKCILLVYCTVSHQDLNIQQRFRANSPAGWYALIISSKWTAKITVSAQI